MLAAAEGGPSQDHHGTAFVESMKRTQAACTKAFKSVTHQAVEARSRRPNTGVQHVFLDGATAAGLNRLPHVIDMQIIGKQIDAGVLRTPALLALAPLPHVTSLFVKLC
jgi:hypothetical protein